MDLLQKQRLGEKPVLPGPLAYLTRLPKHPPILHLHPRPSFPLLNQEHPGEFPQKMVHRRQPSLFSSSINSEASSTRTVPGTAPGITRADSYHRPHPSSIHTQTPQSPSQALQCIYLKLNSISGSSLISLCVGARMRSLVLILN